MGITRNCGCSLAVCRQKQTIYEKDGIYQKRSLKKYKFHVATGVRVSSVWWTILRGCGIGICLPKERLKYVNEKRDYCIRSCSIKLVCRCNYFKPIIRFTIWYQYGKKDPFDQQSLHVYPLKSIATAHHEPMPIRRGHHIIQAL